MGRRPGRRGAAGVPRDARDRPALGDARAGRRRDHRRAGRRRRDPARRAHGRAGHAASSRRPRAVGRRARAGRTATRSTSSARCWQELGGEYHELASADRRGDAGAVRPGRERDPDRARREPAVAVDAPPARLGRSPTCSGASGDIDVHVISSGARRRPRRRARGGRRRGRAGRGAPRSSPRRRIMAWALAIAGAAAAHARCWRNVRDALTLPSDLLLFLLLVVVVAALGGLRPRVRVRDHRLPARQLVLHAAVPRVHDRRGREPGRAGRSSSLVGGVVSAARGHRVAAHRRGRPRARRGRDPGGAERHAARRPTTRCRSSSASCGSRSTPTVGRGAAAQVDGTWTVVAAVGDPGARPSRRRRPRRPAARRATCSCSRGAGLGADDLDVLRAFAGQVALAVRAARAARRRRARRRTGGGQRAAHRAARRGVARPAHAALVDQGVGDAACCSATSTSRPAATRELLETIDEGTDRLNHLVGNLLDMSRLQTGALQLVMRDVGLDEVRAGRARGPDRRATGSTSTSPRRCRASSADAALLERAVANVVENALAWSPPDRARAGRGVRRCSDRVELQVVDRGPGIPVAQRERRVPTVPAPRRPVQRQRASGSASRSPAASSRRWAARSRSTTRPAAA